MCICFSLALPLRMATYTSRSLIFSFLFCLHLSVYFSLARALFLPCSLWISSPISSVYSHLFPYAFYIFPLFPLSLFFISLCFSFPFCCRYLSSSSFPTLRPFFSSSKHCSFVDRDHIGESREPKSDSLLWGILGNSLIVHFLCFSTLN